MIYTATEPQRLLQSFFNQVELSGTALSAAEITTYNTAMIAFQTALERNV